MSDTAPNMPEVDRSAATAASVRARRQRADLKQRLKSGGVSPIRVFDLSASLDPVAGSLRVRDFLASLPSVGVTKADAMLNVAGVNAKKRLGGLGLRQRDALRALLLQRYAEPGSHSVLTVLAGPSGVGKGTVVAHLKEHFPNIRHSVSVTTRPARSGEVDGRDYFFVSDEEFDHLLVTNNLLEWAVVHGTHRYGTPRPPVELARSRGEHMLLEIDIEGARQVRQSAPDAQLIFLSPPSWEELVRRLESRGTETPEQIARRLETAQLEMDAVAEFDHVVVNEDVQLAAETIVNLMMN